jgi:hypothetical protein
MICLTATSKDTLERGSIWKDGFHPGERAYVFLTGDEHYPQTFMHYFA